MTVDEIEKIVNLINNTSDEEIKRILRRLLATWVEREGTIPAYKGYPIPTIYTKPTCSKCGLVLDGAMCYSCPTIDCPAGMGPTVC